MIQTPASRAAFISSAISYLRSHNFDGLNLDWHLPNAFYKDHFTALVQELDQAFINEAKDTRKTQLLLSANVPGLMSRILSYDAPGIGAHLDFFNVVTFDFHGHWDPVTGHNSPLYSSSKDTGNLLYHNVNASISFWLSQGAPAQKLLMGFPNFGRTFRLSSTDNGLGAPANGAGDAGPYTQTAGFWAYYEVCLFLSSASVVWIEEQEVPYATYSYLWVGYDDKRSFSAKVQRMTEFNLGGAHVWTMDYDDFSGHFCSQGTYPLIRHLRMSMGLPNPPTTTPAPTTTRDPILEFCKGRPDGLYENVADRNTYFQCFQGITYLHRCQPGLIFWDSCKCCNWP
ncbi:acidic mammalian chitinase-like [Thalassophryne amazonica]|uniref:acidic mammalian chitinase-like n=1 Tax=Thalassophryne amazonica TaxID=390379 RepID=UPI00147254F4|nr:acidic mammalian chitinase-like [Thalassophryne amazonica]